MFHLTSADELTRIHQAALEILSKTGIAIEQGGICDLLVDHGCKYFSGRMLIPEVVVEAALKTVPASVVLYDRDGLPACHLGSGKTCCQPVGGTPFVIDLDTSYRRPALLKDFQDIVRLIDNLKNIQIVTVATTPTDVDDIIQSYIGFATTLMFSKKPVSVPGSTSANEVRCYAQLAAAVFNESDFSTKPRFVMSILPVSPLQFTKGLDQAIAETAHLGIPISIVPLPITGISAPLALAGALAQQHAENLAAVVIAQSVRPGLPMVYHGRLSIGNMRTGASIWGSYEVGLAGAIAATLGKRCGLPTNVYGFSTSAKTPDVQSGAERMINAILPFLAGADILGGAGSIGDILAMSAI